MTPVKRGGGPMPAAPLFIFLQYVLSFLERFRAILSVRTGENGPDILQVRQGTESIPRRRGQREGAGEKREKMTATGRRRRKRGYNGFAMAAASRLYFSGRKGEQ